MFRYLSGVTETMGLNDLHGFVDPQLMKATSLMTPKHM